MTSPILLNVLRRRFFISAGVVLLTATVPLRAQEIIVDDLDPVNAPAAGAWSSVNASGGNYGTTYKRDSDPGSGQTDKPLKTLSFTPRIITAGNYDVYVRTPKVANGASNVPITITHANGTAEARFNQRAFGDDWILLGTYAFKAGKAGRVTYGNAGTDGSVAADAIKLVRVLPIPFAAAASKEIVVDNSDRANVTKTGAWTPGLAPSAYKGNELLDAAVAQGTKPVKTIKFAPKLTAGDYDIYLWHSSSEQHDAKVKVSIQTASKISPVQTVAVDQRVNGGQWVLLGRYPLAAGRAGSVTVTNAGTTGIVSADAVRYLKAPDAADKAVFAKGLAAWRKPDGNGITCMQCHGPAGYDIAVFNFNQADLRRAVVPAHLTTPEADAIYAMIQQLRIKYPPAGGLKDIRTFRPMQPADGVMSGSDTESSVQQDAAFGRYLVQTFRVAQERVTTAQQARVVLNEFLTMDVPSIPFGIRLPLWSSSISRQGHGEFKGGGINEWLSPIGIQVKPEFKDRWMALNDAYIADPSDENLFAMFRVIPDVHMFEDEASQEKHGPDSLPWFRLDPHNARVGMAQGWGAIALAQLKSNMLFQHDQLQRALGVSPILDRQDGRGLLGNAKASRFSYETKNFMWTVGETTNFHVRFGFVGGATPDDAFLKPQFMPRRDEETSADWLIPLSADQRGAAGAHMSLPWFFLGWVYDNGIDNSGDATRGEYFASVMVPQDEYNGDQLLVFHKAFALLTVSFRTEFEVNPYNPQPQKSTHGWPFTKQVFGASPPLDRVKVPGYPTANADIARLVANGWRSLLFSSIDWMKAKGFVQVAGADREQHISRFDIAKLHKMDPEWTEQDDATYAEWANLVRTLPTKPEK